MATYVTSLLSLSYFWTSKSPEIFQSILTVDFMIHKFASFISKLVMATNLWILFKYMLGFGYYLFNNVTFDFHLTCCYSVISTCWCLILTGKKGDNLNVVQWWSSKSYLLWGIPTHTSMQRLVLAFEVSNLLLLWPLELLTSDMATDKFCRGGIFLPANWYWCGVQTIHHPGETRNSYLKKNSCVGKN